MLATDIFGQQSSWRLADDFLRLAGGSIRPWRKGLVMKRLLWITGIIAGMAAFWLMAQSPNGSLIQGYRETEVASVADAMEQLYVQQTFMSHEMRPLEKTKVAGPAWTVLMKKHENKEGGVAVQGMLDAIDAAPAGAVYVMAVENGADYAGIGGLMATGMKARGLAGAVIDASIRDTPHIKKMQFPVFSRGVVPATMVGHYRFAGVNVPVSCAGVKVNPGDIVTADEDGVVVVPKAHAADVLKKAQDLDNQEHSTIPFIEKFKSIKEAVAKFGRI
jgi:regulator of RNase E activity RraA